jgi:DNA topoisomerase-3
VDFSGQTPLGPCPKCKAPVFEQPMAYVCEKSVGPERSCDFRSGKVILQQSIERAQMEKLLSTGRTDLLRGFISNKTRRKFSAYLARQPAGNVGFEFEPRAPRKGAAGAVRAAVKPAAEVAGPAKPAKPVKAVKSVKRAKPAKKAAPRTRKATA